MKKTTVFQSGLRRGRAVIAAIFIRLARALSVAPAPHRSPEHTRFRGSALGSGRAGVLLLSSAALCAMMPVAAIAQITTASVTGTVQDPSGATVADATVTATNVSTNVVNRTKTEASGRFVFPSLASGGPYTIAVEAAGFKTEVRSGINLAVNQVVDLSIVFQVGSQNEQVEVHADANQLESTTAAVGQVIGNRSVENLPLNQRNVYSLVFLSPGVTGGITYQYNSLNVSVDGGLPGTTDILVDGIPASPPLIVPIGGFSVFPSVDAVQEFKVMSNQYSAQFGRSGSGIINVILKSGTNQFHGSLYDFVRNSVMDANTYFANHSGTPLPSFSRNQFGGSLTGPVRIPKLYNGKGKTFFLFSYEGLRQNTETELTATVPTALEKAGDFSHSVNSSGAPIVIYDPETTTPQGSGFVRQPFQGNKIPSGRIDPVGSAIAAYYPTPNQAGKNGSDINNYFASGTAPLNIDTYDTKVDEVFNDNNRMFVRYSRRNLEQPAAVLFPKQSQVAEGVGNQSQISNSAAIDYTRTFTPTLVSDIRYGFSRILLNVASLSLGFNPTQLGFPSAIAANADHLLFPGIAPQSYYTLGDGAAGTSKRGAFEIHLLGIDNTKIIGNHVIRFGGDARLMRSNDNEANASTGNYTFTNGITQGPDPNVATAIAGSGIASLLLGVGSGNINFRTTNYATESKYYGMYIQDDWKALPRLTLNLGLRYDLDIPRTERHNTMAIFDPNAISPLAATTGLTGLKGGTVFPGVNGNDRRQFTPQWANFGPRFGFAYQFGSNMTIRGGYGIYYGPSMRNAGNPGQEGFGTSTSYTGSLDGLTPSVYLRNPYPNGLNLPVGTSQGLLTGIGSSFGILLKGDNKVGYTESWDFDIQRQLPFNILIDAAYVGTHGVHLNKSGLSAWNPNQLSPATLTLGTQLQQSVTNPFHGSITTGPESGATVPLSYLKSAFPQYPSLQWEYLTGGYEDYNSFQLKVEKRLSRGLSALVSYTGQKGIDIYSGIQNVGNITGGVQNIFDPRGERAVSSNNISQSLVVSAVYSLPVGRNQIIGRDWNRAADLLLGGWQINGITTHATGFPLSPTTQDTSHSGGNVLRPNLTGVSPVLHGSVKSRLSGYLNAAAFSQPAAFTFGNAPRTLSNVRAPSNHNIDLSIFKNFHVTDSVQAQFRAESFNLLNQVVFGSPNMGYASGQFGVISSQANTPREIQLALKMNF